MIHLYLVRSIFLIILLVFIYCFQIPSLHPGSGRVALMCQAQMKGEVLISSQTTVLHTLTLLKEVIPLFSKEYIKVGSFNPSNNHYNYCLAGKTTKYNK